MAALAKLKGQPAPAGQPHPANDQSQRTEGSARALLRFITCGSVDDGKSTLIGRILYEAGAVFDDQLTALDSDSRKFGTQGAAPDFALLVDGLSAEREQGITIDVAYRYFSTDQRSFIVADTPGHEQYTRNMATGASTADLAIILIDARKGLLPQTRRHSFIVSLVGVRHIVVAVNKMDLVGYDEAVFRQIEQDYRKAVAGLGFASIDFVPVSARDGENVTSLSRLTPWYRGPALLPLLESVVVVAEAEIEAGFALPVQWVNRPDLDFRGFAGTVARGRLRVGDAVAALPSGRRSTIARILAPSGDVSQASAGQSVTITLSDEIDISRGDVIASVVHAPVVKQELQARLLWTGEAALREGGEFILKLATANANAQIVRLHHSVDIESYAEAPAENLAMNGIGLATLTLDRPLAVLDYTHSRELGGFILIDRLSNQTVAFGFVETRTAPNKARSIAETGAAVRVALRFVGWRGAQERRAWFEAMSWRLASGVFVFAVVALSTEQWGLAAVLALGESRCGRC
ncbi:Sulfate adenylyltransferase subunit 1 [Bosea sp. 62]|uniref:sulfate adenylyltransferase subunit CysN n=1 Tax=unclassified Bosea (in: a-proteobacteria) TaxID=2653178 RepID=UPI00125C58FC|nr:MULTISPECIES: sulfate adenylyltransferase subunit CysN [unclassified Bosea (in: a-proteobacteria)]CAD5257971.1 Sulfate adenylyltransferase subunit 1 [Bosea sp. 46]CAD5262410.1 Sulfate adenylyltransferase subunit 1 [Bosea sp. 21B]CAD5278056.1 Sulfate adenylyltransferase subunit 1 [Bosea sp. 7B]VVT58719.1 Sulfate adenylyltransferase subunit 1 [Bosea sp. EC-HK365B]VXB59287.1 Sulfate adenylyltransferase subunit 1 [Bosea sp. 29B]